MVENLGHSEWVTVDSGPKITDFEVGKRIGRGAFGTVYEAKYKPNNVYVALKQLSKQTVLRENKQEAVK
jgi:serine/threonine protein kinase